MITSVADFAPLIDGPISLIPGREVDVDVGFNLPSDIAGTAGILSFMQAAASPNDLTFSIAINGVTQFSGHEVDSPARHAKHERVGALRVGANTLRIEAAGGTGSLEISNVILLFHRDVYGTGLPGRGGFGRWLSTDRLSPSAALGDYWDAAPAVPALGRGRRAAPSVVGRTQ